MKQYFQTRRLISALKTAARTLTGSAALPPCALSPHPVNAVMSIIVPANINAAYLPFLLIIFKTPFFSPDAPAHVAPVVTNYTTNC